ncbi:hypothetical protein [Streptomyces sp. NPDC088915]|uniref:hypothetical protein n=1 Tax=Streptomyces sp. NPDC088915 TaxID=3365912 RepID=UPI003821009C
MTTTLPTIDYADVRAGAVADVRETLQQIADPKARRAAADEIRETAFLSMATIRPERDELIAAYALHHPEDRDALAQAFGIVRSTLRRIQLEALGQTWGEAGAKLPAKADRPRAAEDAGLNCTDETGPKAVDLATRFQDSSARWKEALDQIGLADAEAIAASGRRVVPKLDRPDFASIRKQAEEQVNKEFATISRPDERLERAAEIVNEAQDELDRLIEDRDKAIASLTCYTTARGINLSAGLSRTGVLRVMQKALKLGRDAALPAREQLAAAGKDAGVPMVKDAHEALPRIAREYETHRALRDAAMPIRNAAIPVMAAAPYEWAHQRIADEIGVPASYVTRTVNA